MLVFLHSLTGFPILSIRSFEGEGERADNRTVFFAVRKTGKIGDFSFYIYIFTGVYSSGKAQRCESLTVLVYLHSLIVSS